MFAFIYSFIYFVSITVPPPVLTLFKIYTYMRLTTCTLTATNVDSDLHCLLKCKVNKACLSVNVHASNQVGFDCQLNHGVRNSKDCMLVADEHAWIYEFTP